MKKVRIIIANVLWIILCTKRWLLFWLACYRQEAAQKKLLLQIIRKNQDTDFGKKFKFSSIGSVDDFKQRVPLATYEAYVDWVDKIGSGVKNVLTAGAVSILEPTSGSTSATKLIPFTNDLKEEFLAGISPWIFDLFISNRKMLAGTAYWSITPTIQEKAKSSGGIPIGFKYDSEYFSKFERLLIGSVLSVPKEVSEISDVRNFRYATLLFLLRDRDLAFVSVWNPTFLTILLSYFDGWKESLLKDIAAGTITFPGRINALVARKIEQQIKSDKKRAREIETILRNGEWKGRYDIFWPKLSVISCWADGNSQYYIAAVKKMFPKVYIQPKGLFATEGVVSFPLTGEAGAAIALCSHFFEFIDQGVSGEMRYKLLHEIELGKTYAVVVTTGGGLYRYQLGDLVTVVGFKHRCPLVRFQGRGGNVSDLFGEKLNERHVSNVLSDVFKRFDLSPRFFMIAPEKDIEGKVAYILFVELDGEATIPKGFVEKVEEGLLRNFHYRYCRLLSQLSALRVFVIKKDGAEAYLNVCCSFGQKLGDIKMMALRKDSGWSEKFSGSFRE